MALKKLLLITVLTTSWFAGGVVLGQVNVPSPQFRPFKIEEPESTRPLAQPGIFDYDAQVFAPVEFSGGKEPDPNTGFFFLFERGYSNLSRGGQIGDTVNAAIATGNDWGWGNRFEFGWMGEGDSGWDVVYQYSDVSYYAFGTDILIATPLLVNTNFSQVDVNRVFRQALSNGDYFEPFVGMKYYSLSDNSLEDITLTVNGTAATNRFKQNATNSAVGFQAGGRYNARRGRFRYTCDAAIVTAYNQQRYHSSDFATIGATIGTSEQYFQNQSFMPAVDGQIEIAYNLSRDFAFRTSLQATYLWDGVNRSNNLTTLVNPNSLFGTGNDVGIFQTDFFAIGLTFGFEWQK